MPAPKFVLTLSPAQGIKLVEALKTAKATKTNYALLEKAVAALAAIPTV